MTPYAHYAALDALHPCGTILPKPGERVACCAIATDKAVRVVKQDMGKEPNSKGAEERIAAMRATCTAARIAKFLPLKGKGPMRRREIEDFLKIPRGSSQDQVARLVKSKHLKRREGPLEWVTFEWVAK